MPDDLREDLLALDDVRRDDLPSQWRGASMAVDEWLHREHGVMSSHHGLGLLLALLDQFGYVVTPPNGSRPELDHAALVDLLRQAMAAGASFFIEESVAGRVRRDVLMMEVFDDFAESFTQIRRSLVEALLNPEEAQDA